MLNTMNDVFHAAGKRGSQLARTIGPTRGLVGVAVAAVAIGGAIFLVRYLRSRKADLPIEGEAELDQSVARNKKRKPIQVHAAH
jgi:hypothetical protein